MAGTTGSRRRGEGNFPKFFGLSKNSLLVGKFSFKNAKVGEEKSPFRKIWGKIGILSEI